VIARGGALLAAGLASCASYAPTRVDLPSLPPKVVQDAVVRALVRHYLGVTVRDLEEGRFVSQSLPEGNSPRLRIRAFVRIVPAPPPGGLVVETTVARERLWTDPDRPGWRVVGHDRDREAILSETIASFARSASGSTP
jgi:hypothetical protein